MIAINRATIAAASIAAILTGGGSSSAASWQQAYLEPAIHTWMGVVTLLADDGERDGDEDRGSKCDGKCDKGDCDSCRRKHHEKEHKHGPRGDAISLLRDIHVRLGHIERMLAARGGPGVPGMAGHPHGGHPGWHDAMKGPRGEMHKRMMEAREKWENASPEERAEMKEKMKARMQEGRERMEAMREKWENASPEERDEMKAKWKARMEESRGRRPHPKPEGAREGMKDPRSMVEAARKRAAELENRVKRLEAELEQLKEILKSRDS